MALLQKFIGAGLQECSLKKTKQSEAVIAYFIGHDPGLEQRRHGLTKEFGTRLKQAEDPVRYERLAAIGRNIDIKTKIDYYSRFSVCGENDSDTETFYFL